MPNLYPGAIWRPIPVSPHRARRRKGRGVGFHIAVSNGPSLFDYFSESEDDSHLYVRWDGTVEQYVDLDLVAYAGRDGNPSMLWVETQGGVGNDANGGLWTPQQCETLAQIAAHAHRAEGAPLDLMPNSLPASRGVGTHRLGIKHSRGAVPGWLVPGGELWSSSVGKSCAGDRRIGQVPGIVLHARRLVGQPAPAPKPAPVPAPARAPRPPVLRWALPAGHWLGNVAGPARQHGGHPRYDSAAVKALVRNVQQWLIYKACVPGVAPESWAVSRWADGLWEGATDAAMTAWHRRDYPGQPYPAQCWADDYARLTR